MTITAASTAHLQVLLFSTLREKIGHHALSVSLETPATGNHLLDHLIARHPVIAPYRSVIRLAVNATYVPMETPLADGDEVALITPVSGG